MKEIFVSLSGSDNGEGTIKKPFKTLEKAAQFAKNMPGNEEVFINIRGGRYFFKESFVLNKDNSGEKDKRVTYRAYNNEKVYFDGGIILDSSKAVPITDERVKDRIIDKNAIKELLEIDLSEYDIIYGKYGTRGFRRPYVPAPNELFIDGEPYDVARYPNKGEELIPLKEVIDSGSSPFEKEFDMRPATFRYEDGRCDFWKNAKGFYVSGLFFWCFADDTLEIANIDTKNKTLTTVLPHLASFKADSFTSWYAVNLLEEIDMPGEYYVDSENKKLYFYPKRDISKSLIQLSVLDKPLVVLKDVSFVSFENIIFENSRGTGVYIENGENCIIKNCVFRNLGMVGVQIGKGATPLPEGKHNAHGIMADGVENPKSASEVIGSWHEMLYQFAAWNNEGGKNHGIENCEIYHTATGGILLGGGDRKTLTPAGNYVNNCGIFEVNRLDRTYKAGVNISGVGNKISNCNIHNMPGFAIYLHGNDHIIEYNKIYEVITEVADAGAIYWGRDLSEVGNIVRYNFIYNIQGLQKPSTGVCAVYLDDYSCFNAVYENYFYNITQYKNIAPFGTVFWNCGGQTSVNNNIFIDCDSSMNPNSNGTHGISQMLHTDELHNKRVHTADNEDMSGVDVTSEVWRNKYPYLYELYTGTYHNEIMCWNNVDIKNNYKMFKDKNNLDFTIVGDELKDIATMYVYDMLMNVDEERMFFKIVDFGKIGRKQTAK